MYVLYGEFSMGAIGAIGQNQDYFKLFGRNEQAIQAAGQNYGTVNGGQNFGVKGVSEPKAEFDWRNLNRFDTTLTGTKPETSNPFEQGQTGTSGFQAFNPGANIFNANAKPVSAVVPAQTIAQGGDQRLQSALAGLGTGELTPNVDNPYQRTIVWA